MSLFADFFRISDGRVRQDLFYTIPGAAQVSVHLSCYRYTSVTDSLLVSWAHLPSQRRKGGTGVITVSYAGKKNFGFLSPSFAKVLEHTGMVPAGNYKLFIKLQADSIWTFREMVYEVDSVLPAGNPVREDMNRLLSADRQGGELQGRKSFRDASRVFTRSRHSMDRHFRRKGITVVPVHGLPGIEAVDLFYGSWFLGRYTMDSHADVDETIGRERKALSDNAASLAGNELGAYRSLFSQLRELKKDRKENETMEGEFSWGSFLSNGQEAFSGLDNNYHELRGVVEMPVLDLPVRFEGFYTTQDRNREVKAGYLRVHYDAARSKDRLLQLIDAYKRRYSETDARSAGYGMVYGKFLQEARTRRAGLLAQLQQESGINDIDPSVSDMPRLRAAAERQAEDSIATTGAGEAAGKVNGAAQRAEQASQAAEARYRTWEAQYAQIQELDARIDRYSRLLEQYRATLRYDSLLAYDRVKDLQHTEDLSYKDLAKKADKILPEGKAKGFLTGITRFDAGMFPAYTSRYTLSGQRMTGMDLGYDVGIAEVGAGYGRTDYVNRDGTVEGYMGYHGRVTFKPVLGQQIGLVYYGYSPGRKLLEENRFFKSPEVSLPSFREPVRILSATYNSELSRFATLSAEYAVSRRQGQRVGEGMQGSGQKDQSAYNVTVAGFIPRTSISVEGGYEHTGRAFENNTLPVMMTGTDRYRGAARGDFFRSFLTLGVEYNYLQQKSLHYTGGNSRWGFDIRTHSKRYPSLALSYKPFSSFRAFDDTLSISQKPILGSVWTGRVNYQIKRQHQVWRFVFLYNRNTSMTDTMRYASGLVQLTTIYTSGGRQATLNLGQNDIRTNQTGGDGWPAFNKSRFAAISAGSMLGKTANLTAGLDIAYSSIGLSRYGFMAAGGCKVPRLPVRLQLQFRYTNYRLEESMGWKQLYAGGLELIWQFRQQLKNGNR